MGGEKRGLRSRNYLVLLIRRTLAGFFNSLPNQYVNIYVVEMGLSEQDLGVLNSVGTLLASIPSAALSFAADASSRRSAYLAGLVFEVLAPLLFLAGKSAVSLAVAISCSLVAFYGVRIVENVLVADSLPGSERAFGFGVMSALSIVASLVAPVVAAHIVNMCGGISVRGIRPLFLLQCVGLLIAYAVAALFVREARALGRVSCARAFRESFSMISLNPWLRRWILLEALGGYVFSLSMPFEMVYAVRVKGADEFVLGYMGAAMSVGSMVALPLVGRVADRVGRVKTILLLRPLFYLSTAIFLLASDPTHLILAWFVRGVWYASIAPFQALALELVPYDYRGRWGGVRYIISLPLRAPASALGGYLYANVAPEAPFVVAAAIDLILRVPLIYMTPETLNRKEYLSAFKRVSD